jgi:hypothetical protein
MDDNVLHLKLNRFRPPLHLPTAYSDVSRLKFHYVKVTVNFRSLLYKQIITCVNVLSYVMKSVAALLSVWLTPTFEMLSRD